MKELSELSVAFGNNFGAIHEAWEHFRNDINSFNSQIYKIVREVSRSQDVEDKIEFVSLQNMTEKDGAWRNFYANVTVNINVKPSDLKIFRKEVAAVSFEVAFDEEIGKFMYGVYFKNFNKLSTEIDEMLFKSEELQAKFKSMKKNDPNIVYFRYEELQPGLLATAREDALAIFAGCVKVF